MADDPRVQQLLDELLDSDATPEAVCASCVELLPVVQDRWRQVCRARDELDALFPPTPESGAGLPAGAQHNTPLPVVTGYEVEAVLGCGGMGVVFRARHLGLNRVVALKMALSGAYAGRPERERFRREAEAVAALRHPNVVQVYDVGDADGRPYFTMEYVEGGSLAQKLAGTPLTARDAAALVATLAGAIHAAHRAGIVHRDLKPANILLTANAPKIGDFGLARRVGDEAGLTRTGTAVGTPSYMAPEQARGKVDAVGPAADVYALGAILYEVLTGRPPFRAETAAETVHQLITQDPVPPSRLNGKVPRDLETICLKCLHKEPRFRYASAAALADDLGHFLRGEAIAARPEGRLSRVARRVRRRPVFSAAVTVATLSTVALIGGGVWAYSERKVTAREVEAERAAAKRAADAELAALERVADADLREMEDSLRKSAWPAATGALERAKSRLGERGSAALHDRIERGTRDLRLVARWDAIRLDSYIVVSNASGATVNTSQSDRDFEEAFRESGFGQIGDDTEVVAARIRSSPLRTFLAAELDYWGMVNEPGTARRDWLLNLALCADADITGWRRRSMTPDNWKDEASIATLIDTTPPEYPAVLILIKIEKALTDLGRDPVPLMKRYQRAHTDDLWLNFRLGNVLSKQKKPEEAIRFYQSALAVRPKTSILCNNLGVALWALGRHDEAVEQFRRALDYAPSGGMVRVNLCVLLSQLGRHDEALEHGRIALGCEIRNPAAKVGLHTALGSSLGTRGRDGDALAEFQRAVALDPKHLPAQSGLRDILMRQGKREDARGAWEKALGANPPEHDAWYGYAELCLFLGKQEEYPRARRALLDKFGQDTNPSIAERTARACLLLPVSGAELRRAVTLADRAVAAVDRSTFNALHASYLFAGGLADYREGRFDRAVAVMRGHASRVLGPASRLVLAMALHQSGRAAEARETLAAAVVSHDWRGHQVRDQDGWVYHILRREAEGMIIPQLPAFLEGKYQPQDNDERLALLDVCQFTNRTVAAARLYEDAFAADPQLANHRAQGHRFNAARSAGRAGCGHGVDGAKLDPEERVHWRERARQWMRMDLAAWGGAPPQTTRGDREWLGRRLSDWLREPDLAGLREPAELEKLPESERQDCRALWGEVDGLLKRTAESR